jgi:antitoxin VapB
VFVERQGDVLVLRPKPTGWDDFFARKPRVPENFLKDRKDHPPEKRELF